MPTIRYYEEVGLLAPPMRSGGNRRQYGADDVRRLIFIRHARELGFEIDSIRALLALQGRPDCSCAAADQIARTRLADVEQRVTSLTALQAELRRMVVSCAHGTVGQCRVIEALAGVESRNSM